MLERESRSYEEFKPEGIYKGMELMELTLKGEINIYEMF